MAQKTVEEVRIGWDEYLEGHLQEEIEHSVKRCVEIKKTAEEKRYSVLGVELLSYGFPADGAWAAEWYMRRVAPEVRKQVPGNLTFETKTENAEQVAKRLGMEFYPNGFTQIIAVYRQE
jgi:hypothetical protein